jgi:hypothetical protein
MKSKGNISPLINTRLARVIVILFLSYAAVDLMNPQLCAEDFTPAPMSAVAVTVDLSSKSTDIFLARSDLKQEQEQPAPPAPHDDEDCFCCCAHALPGLTNHPNGSSNTVSLTPTNVSVIAASPDLKALYHPPRFANPIPLFQR